VTARLGAPVAFGVPGGGPNLDLIGALEQRGVRFVLAHTETGACIMASTFGHLVGRPAVALCTRGPGAASAVNGAAQATLDRMPLVLVTDTVPSVDRERVAHQRFDQRALFAPVTKWSTTLGPEDAEALVARAFGRAAGWPAGAVHLDVDESAGPPAPEVPGSDGAATATAGADVRREEATLARARTLLDRAKRPVAIAGLHAVVDGPAVRAFVEARGLPVLLTYQAAGLLAFDDRRFAGFFTGGRSEAPLLDEADLVVTIGFDHVEPIPTPWNYRAPVITVDRGAQRSSYLHAEVVLTGDVSALLDRLGSPDGPGTMAAEGWEPDAGGRSRERVLAELRAVRSPGLDPVGVVEAVGALAPAGTVVTVDAGAHFLAVMPFWPAASAGSVLISNGLATMGFALPAAIGAALARPGTPVVAFVGDGGLSMTLGELETIARLALPVTVVVFNDSALSLIEVKQRDGHGGLGAVRYRPSDFAAVARALGVEGVVATSEAELRGALDDGWGKARLVDARIDPGPYRHLIRVTRG